MTVKELTTFLKDFDEDADVVLSVMSIDGSDNYEYTGACEDVAWFARPTRNGFQTCVRLWASQ